MSLDDLISKNKSTHQFHRGRAPAYGGGGPAYTGPAAASTPVLPQPLTSAAPPPLSRSPEPHLPSFPHARLIAQTRQQMVSSLDEPTKLYISNLDYGVSNEDIKELFSDVGDIKRYSINYDRSGRSKGTAEIVFSRRSDALAAVKRYNNVQLDGKTMKIEIIGTNIEVPPTPTTTFSFNRPPANFNVPFKSVPGRGSAGGWPQVRGGFSGPGQGRGGRGRGRGRGRGGRGGEKVSAEDLDADLDKYHAAAVETS